MEITWMGQAGLLFQKDGLNIMIDPYLSDSVKKIEPNNYRRVPVCERFFDIKPDVLIITHCHLDHLDPETLDVFFSKFSGITVLAPDGCWQTLRQTYKGNNNYVLFNPGTRWTYNGVTFKAVKAEHSDKNAIGVVIVDDKTYYATGDTLCNDEVIACAKKENPGVVFLPVNGVGNNMNMIDGAFFCNQINSDVLAVPVHTGMFDSIDAHDFPYENKVVPTIYQKIEL